MAQTPFLIEAAISLVSISFIYIALFCCGLVVFLLTLIIFQWAGSKQCPVCLKRLRRSDNYCHYCGTAAHPIVRPEQPATYNYNNPREGVMPQRMLSTTSTVYRPGAAWPPVSQPPAFKIPPHTTTSARYVTDSYNTIDNPDYLCPTCHGPLHLSDTFCGNCGGRLVPTVHQIRQHS